MLMLSVELVIIGQVFGISIRNPNIVDADVIVDASVEHTQLMRLLFSNLDCQIHSQRSFTFLRICEHDVFQIILESWFEIPASKKYK